MRRKIEKWKKENNKKSIAKATLGQKRPCHKIYGKYSIQRDFGTIVKGKTFGKQQLFDGKFQIKLM